VLHTLSHRRVDCVNERVKGAPPQPPPRWAWPQDRPHCRVRPRAGDCVNQHGGPLDEPINPAGAPAWRLSFGDESRIGGRDGARGHDLGRPPVATPDVMKQFAHRPPRTRRDRSRGIAGANQVAKRAGLVEQDRPVIHTAKIADTSERIDCLPSRRRRFRSPPKCRRTGCHCTFLSSNVLCCNDIGHRATSPVAGGPHRGRRRQLSSSGFGSGCGSGPARPARRVPRTPRRWSRPETGRGFRHTSGRVRWWRKT
jgi:hypothetical protein